jgi:uncharacterized protein YqeY
MTLQEKIKKDLAAAMKAKDEDTKSALRVVLGELARSDQKRMSDEAVVKILQKLVKAEKEVIEKQGGGPDTAFIGVVEGYLPKMATDDEINAWVSANIDFSQYKNKMQAMGPIMRHFGANADGTRVRQLLQQM